MVARALAAAWMTAVVAACGTTAAEREPTSAAPTYEPAWTTYRDPAHGFSVAYPADRRRAGERLTPHLDDPREILSLGTFQLGAGSDRCASHIPVNALEDLGPTDAFVSIQERRDPSTEHSGPRPATFPIYPDTLDDADMCIRSRDPLTMWVPFTDRGRAFYALYVLGGQASDETRTELQRILGSLTFEPRQ